MHIFRYIKIEELFQEYEKKYIKIPHFGSTYELKESFINSNSCWKNSIDITKNFPFKIDL